MVYLMWLKMEASRYLSDISNFTLLFYQFISQEQLLGSIQEEIIKTPLKLK